MPPENPNIPDPLGGADPNTIDINLSLLGATSGEALQALVAQLSQVNQHLAVIQEGTYAGQTRRAARSTRTASGVEDSGTASSRASVSGEQHPGHQETHEGRSPAPQPGERIVSPSPDAPTVEMPAIDPYQRGWRARDVYTSGEAPRPGEERNADPTDFPFRQRLRAAWQEAGRHDQAGQPGYGRIGSFIDYWNLYNQPSQQPGGLPGSPPGRPPGGPPGPTGPMYEGGDEGHPSRGASVGGTGRDRGDELYNLDPNNIDTGLGIAPGHFGGQYTGQDYLNTISRYFARNYMRGIDQREGVVNPDLEAGETQAGARQVWRARAANTFAGAANRFPMYEQLYQGAKARMNYAFGGGLTGFSLKPSDVEQTGLNLGFERTNTSIGPDGLGFNLPGSQYLSAAGQEGLRSRETRFGLAAEPGINKEQANRIVDAIEERGWSGRDRSTMAYTSLGPLFQRQGIDPQAAMPLLDESVRYGTGSLQQFNEAMNGLGHAARAAHMPMNAMLQSMNDYAEASVAHGTTYVQGLQQAHNYTAITGLNPQIGAQTMNNPLIESVGMAQYGLMPSQQGLLGASGQTQLTEQTINQAMQAMSGYNHPMTVPLDPRHPDGPKRTIAGRDLQIAMVAQTTGLSRETVAAYVNRRNQIDASSAASGGLDQWRHDIMQLQRQHVNTHPGGHEDPRLRQLEQRGMGPGPSWNWIAQQLRDAGVSSKEVARISHLAPDKRADSATSALTDATNRRTHSNIHGQHQNTVYVKFTGAAAKFFEQVNHPGGGGGGSGVLKTAANAGESLLNTVFGGPVGTGIDVLNMINPF